MLPINLLQSQLAHNKKRINELQAHIKLYKLNRGFVLKTLSIPTELTLEELQSLKQVVINWNIQIKSTRKQLKQLAILQKSIKQAVSEYRVDYEVMFGGE